MAWTEEARRKSAETRRRRAQAKLHAQSMTKAASDRARSMHGSTGRLEAAHTPRRLYKLEGGGAMELAPRTRQSPMQVATALYNRLVGMASPLKKKEYPTYLPGLRARANAQPRTSSGKFESHKTRNATIGALLGARYTGSESELMKKRVTALNQLTQVASLQTRTKRGTVRVATRQLANAVYRTGYHQLSKYR